MKIGHFMEGIWDQGGIASYIRRISEAQRTLGHEVVFFDTREAAVAEREWQPIIARDTKDLYARAIDSRIDILHVHKAVDCEPSAQLPVVRTLHGHGPYCLSGTQFLQRSGRPCERTYDAATCLMRHVTERCGSVRPKALWNLMHERQREKQVLSRMDVILISDFLRQRMLAAGYPNERLHLLHHFSPLEDQSPSSMNDGEPHFAFVGRITPSKGCDWLVRAFAKMRQRAWLHIVGAGDCENFVQELVRNLGIQDRVVFHGWLEKEQTLAVVESARALVVPSLWQEPAGLVTLEAMSLGRPVIASRVGGIPEFVRDRESGLLVSPGSISELADAMDLLAEDLELAKEFGACGLHLARQEFTLARHMVSLARIYEQAATRH